MKIASETAAAIDAHARDAEPQECCGLLLGTGDEIILAMRAANRAEAPERRYLIDPHDHFAAIRRARQLGCEVVGAYHSHPRSAPIPSDTDTAEAFEDFVFIIAGRHDDRPFALRAWRYRAGNFAELALVCVG